MLGNFKEWLKAAATRAIRTMAQSALAIIGTSALTMGDVDWKMVVSASALAALISLLTAIAGLPEVKAEDKGVDI